MQGSQTAAAHSCRGPARSHSPECCQIADSRWATAEPASTVLPSPPCRPKADVLRRVLISAPTAHGARVWPRPRQTQGSSVANLRSAHAALRQARAPGCRAIIAMPGPAHGHRRPGRREARPAGDPRSGLQQPALDLPRSGRASIRRRPLRLPPGRRRSGTEPASHGTDSRRRRHRANAIACHGAIPRPSRPAASGGGCRCNPARLRPRPGGTRASM